MARRTHAGTPIRAHLSLCWWSLRAQWSLGNSRCSSRVALWEKTAWLKAPWKTTRSSSSWTSIQKTSTLSSLSRFNTRTRFGSFESSSAAARTSSGASLSTNWTYLRPATPDLLSACLSLLSVHRSAFQHLPVWTHSSCAVICLTGLCRCEVSHHTSCLMVFENLVEHS